MSISPVILTLLEDTSREANCRAFSARNDLELCQQRISTNQEALATCQKEIEILSESLGASKLGFLKGEIQAAISDRRDRILECRRVLSVEEPLLPLLQATADRMEARLSSLQSSIEELIGDPKKVTEWKSRRRHSLHGCLDVTHE